jgi:hypothetical protein
MIMRSFSIVVVCLMALCLQGCGDDKKLDGEIVKTTDGRYFTIVHNVGDTYLIHETDVNKIKKDADAIK